VPDVDEPVMIHDMALTGRFVVLVLAPAFFDLDAVVSGGPLLAWRPERGVRVALVPRDGGPVRWASDEAFWLWHTVNAYDTGPQSDADVVLDFVQWSRLTVGDEGSGGGGGGEPVTGALVRAVVDPEVGTVHRTVLDDVGVEFPRVDDRVIGSRHRWLAVAGRTGRVDLLPGEYDALRWYDTATGTVQVWRAGDLSVGEPVHAPAPGDPSPEHGHWLTLATNRTDATSHLLVIPAQDPTTGPIAHVRIPVRVPLGLHGTWLPTRQ
jgi:carotenoid cleavage dioxygenase